MKLSVCVMLQFFLPVVLFGQNASLRGTITDESGAIVPGTRVTLTGTTGNPQTVTADDSGSYSIIGITPGNYSVEASAPDLKIGHAKVVIGSGAQILNLQLKVVGGAEQITFEDPCRFRLPLRFKLTDKNGRAFEMVVS